MVFDIAGKIYIMNSLHDTTDPKSIERISKAGGFCLNGRINNILQPTKSVGDMYLKCD